MAKNNEQKAEIAAKRMPTNEANDSFPMMSLRMPAKTNGDGDGDTVIASNYPVL